MSASPTVRHLSGKKASATRWQHDNVDEISRDLAAEKIADYIKRTVDAAPPLTAEQRERLAAILRGGQVA